MRKRLSLKGKKLEITGIEVRESEKHVWSVKKSGRFSCGKE